MQSTPLPCQQPSQLGRFEVEAEGQNGYYTWCISLSFCCILLCGTLVELQVPLRTGRTCGTASGISFWHQLQPLPSPLTSQTTYRLSNGTRYQDRICDKQGSAHSLTSLPRPQIILENWRSRCRERRPLGSLSMTLPTFHSIPGSPWSFKVRSVGVRCWLLTILKLCSTVLKRVCHRRCGYSSFT